jgi:hypothetical protein
MPLGEASALASGLQRAQQAGSLQRLRLKGKWSAFAVCAGLLACPEPSRQAACKGRAPASA